MIVNPLPLNIIDILDARETQALVDALHPLLVLDSKIALRATKINIQLLERLVLGLGHEPPDEQATAATEGREEDIGSESHAGEHVLGGETDDEVEHPVRRGDNRDTARTHRGRENLLRQHPGHWTPGVGEVDSEEPNEGNGHPTFRSMGRPAILVGTITISNMVSLFVVGIE